MVLFGASFRDPQNRAVTHDGNWYRLADNESADALRCLRRHEIYDALTGAGSLLAFEEVDAAEGEDLLKHFNSHPEGRLTQTLVVFRVESLDLISYPWEWPNKMLADAALLTTRIRRELLGAGLDLKDASAFNIQFRGSQPVLMDVGSIEKWRPSPSWNALNQFVGHFVNPLAVGYSKHISSAQAWRVGFSKGLSSTEARALMPLSLRSHPGLFLLQSSTRAVKGHVPIEKKYEVEVEQRRSLAQSATLALTSRLERVVQRLDRAAHQTTWADYGSREHYLSEEIQSKKQKATEFVRRHGIGSGPVIDVGGNDGLVGEYLAENLGVPVTVVDPDVGALESLLQRVGTSSVGKSLVTPLIGDLSQISSGSGLLGTEFAAFRDRVAASAVLCQAVLHHLTITQGIPLVLAARALAQFNAPTQVEAATETDEKVRLLTSQIPNWRGEYSLQAVVDALAGEFEHVEVVDQIAPSRVLINCLRPRRRA